LRDRQKDVRGADDGREALLRIVRYAHRTCDLPDSYNASGISCGAFGAVRV
jgi:hypothetical protein